MLVATKPWEKQNEDYSVSLTFLTDVILLRPVVRYIEHGKGKWMRTLLPTSPMQSTCSSCSELSVIPI